MAAADPLVAALGRATDPSRVLARPIDRIAYASDASFYRLIPRAVVQPASEAEVAALLATCAAHGVPLTFRAAGTSLSGQAVTDGVLVDVSRHWGRLEILDGGRRVRAQPGVVGGRVNAALAAAGRRIGPDPASIDACMIGGIVANNASGMCCGVADNAYHTLESMRLILASGITVDTARADADDELRARAPAVHAGLLALRLRLLADETLAARVRAKYRIKNTTGYALNALLDHDTPAQILAHLLVGSEGTLGFVAEVVLRTVPDPRFKRTGLAFFASSDDAFAAVAPLAAAGARAVELMDAACLRAVRDEPGLGVDIAALPAGAAALLVEYGHDDAAARDAARDAEDRAAAALPLIVPARFTGAAAERAALWHVRKGLFPAVGATRRPGQTVIIEDVAFPPARQASAFRDLRRLLGDHGYGDAILFGHARDGNLHFVLTQAFAPAAEIARYERLMDDLVGLVVAHDGSLKAEHGTGRNVAPFVATEWGADAYALMRDLKALLDPGGVLNPGVILNDDRRAHVAHVKALPVIDDEVDRCIECGFCEPVCPSRRLTTTPRQRIVVRREVARLRATGDRGGADALAADYAYAAVDTCAADGLCATACPVHIDTGALMKRLRGDAHPPAAQRRAAWVARHLRAVEALLRVALRLGRLGERLLGARAVAAFARGLGRLLRRRLPRWTAALPAVPRRVRAAAPDAADLVYVPACLSRIMGRPRERSRSLPETFLALCARAGVRAAVPADLAGRCCGVPFASKGFRDAHAAVLAALVDDLWRWTDGGRIPAVVDATSCVHGVVTGGAVLDEPHRQRLAALRVVDAVVFARDALLPRLAPTRLPRRVVLHPTCAAKKLGIADALRDVAAACADDVRVPIAAGCCGMAGDRGLLYPELTAAATADEAAEARAAEATGHYSSNLTCEIALSEATAAPYVSVLYLLAEATETRAGASASGLVNQ